MSQVEHPSHYGGGDNPYEVIKVLHHWLSREEYRGALKFNIHKYLARADKKGGLEDLRKAQWYLAELIRFDESGAGTSTSRQTGQEPR